MSATTEGPPYHRPGPSEGRSTDGGDGGPGSGALALPPELSSRGVSAGGGASCPAGIDHARIGARSAANIVPGQGATSVPSHGSSRDAGCTVHAGGSSPRRRQTSNVLGRP